MNLSHINTKPRNCLQKYLLLNWKTQPILKHKMWHFNSQQNSTSTFPALSILSKNIYFFSGWGGEVIFIIIIIILFKNQSLLQMVKFSKDTCRSKYRVLKSINKKRNFVSYLLCSNSGIWKELRYINIFCDIDTLDTPAFSWTPCILDLNLWLPNDFT